MVGLYYQLASCTLEHTFISGQFLNDHAFRNIALEKILTKTGWQLHLYWVHTGTGCRSVTYSHLNSLVLPFQIMVLVKIPWDLDKTCPGCTLYIAQQPSAGRKFKRRISPVHFPVKVSGGGGAQFANCCDCRSCSKCSIPPTILRESAPIWKEYLSYGLTPRGRKRWREKCRDFFLLNHDMFFHRCDVLWPGDRCAICRLHFALGDNTLYFSCHDITLQRVKSEF